MPQNNAAVECQICTAISYHVGVQFAWHLHKLSSHSPCPTLLSHTVNICSCHMLNCGMNNVKSISLVLLAGLWSADQNKCTVKIGAGMPIFRQTNVGLMNLFFERTDQQRRAACPNSYFPFCICLAQRLADKHCAPSVYKTPPLMTQSQPIVQRLSIKPTLFTKSA